MIGLDMPPHHGAPDRPEPLVPLVRAWDWNERLLSPHLDRDLFLVRDRGTRAPASGAGPILVSRDILNGSIRWTQPLGETPSWADVSHPFVVVAGPQAVQAFARNDGTSLWYFSAPDPATFLDPHLSAFQMTGRQFFCLQGGCRLLALDAGTGRVEWQYSVPTAHLSADLSGRQFSPHYLVTDLGVLVQFAGHCRLLDSITGQVRHDFGMEPLVWEQAPVPVGPWRVGVVIGRRRVAALDLAAGTIAWTYELPRPDSLSGELPLLIGGPDALYLVVGRNYGQGLQRLDPRTGQGLWSEEVDLGTGRIDARCISVDPNGVYYTSRNVVTALAADDGRVLWEQALSGPSGPWRLRREDRILLAWPAEAPRAKFHSRWLTASLELDVTRPPEDGVGRGIPMLLLDLQDGSLVQRLNYVPPPPRVQGCFAIDERLTALPRLFTERAAGEGMAVESTGGSLVVGWGQKTWRVHETGNREPFSRRPPGGALR